MAARRGKSQAKRNNQNNDSLPGWAWGVLGLLLGVVVILVAPKFLKSDGGGDGFFRPQPNPDAQPAAATADEESVAPEGNNGAKPAAGGSDAKAPKAGKNDKEGTDYAFYDLLPGKEVEMSDAEIAATEAAEEQRRAAQQKKTPAGTAATVPATATAPATASLPKPVDTIAPTQPPVQVASATSPANPATTKSPALTATQGPAPTAPAAAATATAAANDNTPYVLQAGAFQASGQAEEMKAKIAMLGLGARVESAQIGGKTVYRVRMGPYGTAGDLADAKRKLADGGLPGMAIKVQ
ncbi:SPOR domain-containing protein [Lysobacter sp. CA199]|uniref:SPOR domain-containing protein n=1 Tax=Lysobacter sp. CA199 TaxID=3455608 RepID=UPI003F8D5E72